MTAPLDPRLALVERRLERLPAAAPSAALRRRVLAAVDGVLARPAPPPAVRDDRLPLWAGAAAVAAGVAIVAACLASVAPLPRGPQFTLVERLRIAGVADDGQLGGLPFSRPGGLRETLVAAAAAPPRPADSGPLARPAAVTPAARAAFRVIDARRLLEENP